VLPIIENIFHCYLSLPVGTSTINHPCLLKYLPTTPLAPAPFQVLALLTQQDWSLAMFKGHAQA